MLVAELITIFKNFPKKHILTLLLGSFLASFIDRAVSGSVTPIAVGYLVYAIASLASQVWAGALSGDSSRPVADNTV